MAFLGSWKCNLLLFVLKYASLSFDQAEEPPSALLMAHAALLSSRKEAHRRAALLYFYAASRLEKHGIVSIHYSYLSHG
jgi:trafficking protein particle complex subunit 8